MTTLDDDPTETGEAIAGLEPSQFGWEVRVMAVSAVWVVPGVVAGALTRLCIPEGGPSAWWLLGGGAVASIAGGLLEADHWP
ncbi:MAG: hypothetical protein JWO38_8353 [Gemmataceae bacterium]|nr:hypothetical protein [Gemmataceae bacterium]